MKTFKHWLYLASLACCWLLMMWSLFLGDWAQACFWVLVGNINEHELTKLLRKEDSE